MKILLYLLFEILMHNDASIPNKDFEILSRRQVDNNQYIYEQINPQWDNDVSEVLYMLGVSDISGNPAVMQKRHEKKDYISRNMQDHGMNIHLQKPGFKWQYAVIATVCSIAAVTGIIVAASCYYKMNKVTKNGALIGSPSNSSNNGSSIVALGGFNSGDKKLAQSAQMYHYQHQKQQMIALEKADSNLQNEASDDESEPDDAVDDFTVYECPGMAMGGELEVKNPLFQADPPSPTGVNGET